MELNNCLVEDDLFYCWIIETKMLRKMAAINNAGKFAMKIKQLQADARFKDVWNVFKETYDLCVSLGDNEFFKAKQPKYERKFHGG